MTSRTAVRARQQAQQATPPDTSSSWVLFAWVGVLVAAGALFLGIFIAATGSDQTASSGPATVIDVDLGAMVMVPSDLTAPAGRVKVRVTNIDVLPHNFLVNGKGTRVLAQGESQEIDLGDLQPGVYKFRCDVPGHTEAGMVGTLTVTNATAAS